MDLLDITKQCLRALEEGATGVRLAAFYSVDAVQEELPNRLLANGARRDRPAVFHNPRAKAARYAVVIACALTQSIAQRAGGLLAKAKLTSAHAVDAFVVATALDFEAAVIATGDPGDIRRLSSTYRQVKVFAL